MHVELRSRRIDSASYEEDQKTLRIYLTNGQMREFSPVPKHVFEELTMARSAGNYYFQHIKGCFSPSD